MSLKLDLGIDLAIGLGTVLGSVEDENAAIDGESCDKVGVLRTVSGLVDLVWVIDLLHDVPLHGGSVALAVATYLAPVFVVVARIRIERLRDLNFGNLEVILHPVRGVRAEQHPVDTGILALGLLDVGEPLYRQGWPRKSSTWSS